MLWKGNQVIEGAKTSLETLEQKGFKLGFVTNNSSLSREGFKRKFEKLGFNPSNYTIINSAYGAAIYLREKNLNRVYLIGEKGLRKELELQNIYVAEEYEPSLKAVCVGWDRHLTWCKLAEAMRVILQDNGFFLGTNSDNSFPQENILVPGTGAQISALATACGKKPDIVIGKPNRYLIDITLNEMDCNNPAEAVYIGDRLSTDILAGINAGIDTVLVKTGISDNHLEKTILPTFILDSIADIFTILN